MMTMAQAFDEWMRKYKEEPEAFLSCMASARSHERPAEPGVSEYGRDCAAMLAALMARGSDAWGSP